MAPPRVAVILPCRNEAAAIASVCVAFRAALPSADLFVIDNGSTDNTGSAARAAGATVFIERSQGKGHAIRRAFSAIDADIYIIADGDGTYDASQAPLLVDRLSRERLDMVVGTRRKVTDDAYRSGHEMGNRFFNTALKALFNSQFNDIFSGFRVLSHRFVKSFPALADGFEIETEMSVHAIVLRMPVAEVECDYRGRVPGTASKLNKYRDGFRIFASMINLYRVHRPMIFFGALACAFAMASGVLFYPVLFEFLRTGLVPRVPTLILSIGLAMVSSILISCALILDGITRIQLENRRLLYLSAPRQQTSD